jgi:hypothetical protein
MEDSTMSDLREAEMTNDTERTAARKRIEKRRGLQGGFVAYVVVNAFLVGVWALSGRGYFWPAWVIAGWGVGMLLGLWDYLRGPVTESDIDEELRSRMSEAARAFARAIGYRSAGTVEFVEVLSQTGQECSLKNPWNESSVDLYRNGRKTDTLNGSSLAFPTRKGETVVVVRAGNNPDQFKRVIMEIALPQSRMLQIEMIDLLD